MSGWFERYQQGYYHEVYDELLAMQEQVFEQQVYQEAVLVARAMMRRVHSNIEVLIPRLRTLGYQFVDGDWNRYCWDKGELFLDSQSRDQQDEKYRIVRTPPTETLSLLQAAEQRVGTLPLSVKCWYEEVGSVNLIGTFPATATRSELSEVLDPLLMLPIEDLIDQFPFNSLDDWEQARDDDGKIEVALAVDAPLKYNGSGSGGYTIKTPCQTFDTIFDLIYYDKPLTFVNYLRMCFQWGGMFGLSKPLKGQELTPDELAFLTRDLLPF